MNKSNTKDQIVILNYLFCSIITLNLEVLDNSPAVSSIHTNDNNIESQLRTTSVTTPTTSINKNEPYEDLEKILTETETMELFSKPSSSIPITSKYYKEYKGKNERYEQACLYQRDDCPKNFHERAAQTFHFYQLHQSIQTEITSNDVGVGGDAFHDDIGNDMIGGGDCDPKDVLAKTIVEELTSAAIMTEGCLLDVSDGVRPGEKTFMGNLVSASASYLDIIAAKAKQKFYHSYMVLEKLSILERAIQQSIFSSQQIKYRGVNIVNNDKNHTTTVTNTNADTEISGKNSDNCDSRDQLELLLSLECDLTANMKVTCMSWNKSNRDLLAVGYGGKRNSVHKEGFVMLWSIRNPQYPEKVFKFTSSVTTVAFSLKNFEILAVGLHDGKVLLYDIAMQVSFSSPMLDSAFSPGRHMSAVSKLQWVVDTHQDASEQLVSVSVDGRILKWSSKKGLSVSPLITLKRTDAKINKGKLQNTALGLSMDFLRDGMSYLAGSDDGSLYHCSLSYHQHPLTTIKAHTGPITSIHVTPFLDDVFMTSSTDSSVKLYNIAQKLDSVVEVLTIHPINLIGSINDVSWSPKHSTLFVLVAQDNRMELWDVAISCFDPIITLSCQEGRLKEASDSKDRTVVEFSHCGDIIAVGDDQGCVEFHRIHISKRDKIEHLGEVVKRLSK